MGKELDGMEPRTASTAIEGCARTVPSESRAVQIEQINMEKVITRDVESTLGATVDGNENY